MVTLHQGEIVVGALVEWDEDKTYGIVTHMDDKVVRVQWDEEGAPPQFAASAPPLRRVRLQQGQTVRLTNTGQNAALLAPAMAATPAWQCFVAAGDGTTVNIPEAGLRPVPITNPVERFLASPPMIGSLKQYRLQEVTRWYRIQHLYNELVSLGQLGVDIKPHQVSVVHKVVSNYPHRFLLCDEVGLGKTIEAGMTLKEIQARGGGQRVLVIAPPNLVRQWQFEMRTKFNQSFAVLNSRTVEYLVGQGQTGNPFLYEQNVVCSSGWVANPRWSKLCAEVDWDLVIVDEAHHARSKRYGNKIDTTRLYRLVRDLAAPEHFVRRGMLFLTATPMQLDTHELYSLVELLDPTLFPSESHFDEHRRRVPGLSRTAEQLSIHGFPIPNRDDFDVAEEIASWLNIDTTQALQRLSDGKQAIETLTNELFDRHLLSDVMIRNRKSVVGGFMPRSASRWKVTLTTEERAALQAVEEYVEYGFQMAEGRSDQAIGFVMVTFQKLMASSIAAVRESLTKRRNKILSAQTKGQSMDAAADRLDDDDKASDVIEDLDAKGIVANEELTLLENAMNAIVAVKVDSKAQVLISRLAELFHDAPDEKVIVFTQFRETQSYLRDLMAEQGWRLNVFHGQMKAQDKDSAVEQFRTGSGSQILISTEAGGEGRNFQFCHLLVNYDLPWNPMKVEQRIGRVDRIGQEQPINVFNLWVENTVEARVLDVLEHRIRLFEETIGGLDSILGDAEDDITAIMRKAGREREKALEEFGKNLEDQILKAVDAETRLGDFIMDTKSFRKELAEKIAGQPSPVSADDFERFIGQLLAGIRTHIREIAQGYELTFHDGFVASHKRIFPTGNRLRGVFRRDHWHDAEGVEFLVFGHPIIDATVKQVLDEGYEGTTGTRRIISRDGLEPIAGWLFTYQFTIPGPQVTEKLMPIFVSDGGEVNLELGLQLIERATRFNEDEEEIDADSIPDNLKLLEPRASAAAINEWELLQRQVQDEATERVDREVGRLRGYFEYRERAAQDKVDATSGTVNRFRESDDEARQRILPAWEANLRRDEELVERLPEERRRRISEAERHRNPQVSWVLKSLGRIEVLSPH